MTTLADRLRRRSASGCTWILVPAAVLALSACDASAPPPDTIFTGRFITLDDAQPEVDALAVADGRIVAAGSRADIEALAGENTQTVAIGGVAVPGFADSHVHVSGVGRLLERLNVRAMTKEQIVELVAEAVGSTPPGQWIFGRGWDEGFFRPAVFPTARDLDAVSPNNPVMLTRIDGHASWVNSQVLGLSDITVATVDPEGGRVVRDASNRPTGILVDNAQSLMDRVTPNSDSPDAAEQRIRTAMEQYTRWGLTSIHDAGAGLEAIAIYKKLLAAGELPVRVYAMARGDAAVEEYLVRGPEVLGDGKLVVRGFKVILDGALGSRGAELDEPYSDAPEEIGLEQMSDEALDDLIRRAREAGFQVNPHVIGDRAVRRALDAFERAGVEPGERHRLEHASIIAPDDLPRLAQMGIVASMQPVFVGEYGRWAEDRLGSTRVLWVLPIKDLLATGAVLASGTDFPASDSGDPRATLAGLVARQSSEGVPEEGWYPDQAVDVETALWSMSAGPAYATFQEDDLGQLTVGRFADFTVLSDDPRSVASGALLDLTVRMTVLGGDVTFDLDAEGR